MTARAILRKGSVDLIIVAAREAGARLPPRARYA
jgi:hypothetical protein